MPFFVSIRCLESKIQFNIEVTAWFVSNVATICREVIDISCISDIIDTTEDLQSASAEIEYSSA